MSLGVHLQKPFSSGSLFTAQRSPQQALHPGLLEQFEQESDPGDGQSRLDDFEAQLFVLLLERLWTPQTLFKLHMLIQAKRNSLMPFGSVAQVPGCVSSPSSCTIS